MYRHYYFFYYYHFFLQSSKMKRMDFVNGVTSTTFVLLLPIFLQVYGFLDVQEYRSITNENSYYENSTELILGYTHYIILLFAIYTFLIVLVVGLVCVSCKRKALTRFQIECYRPYFLYHCMVCFIPCVLRYANLTGHISDDIMAQVAWKQFFLVKYSIFRFICSFLLSIIQRYELLRLTKYVIVMLTKSFILTFFAYVYLSYCVEFINPIIERNMKFLTALSYDKNSFIGKLNVTNINTYSRTFSLDYTLFQTTGRKVYQTSSSSKLQLEDSKGDTFPYERLTYNVGIGESLILTCGAVLGSIENISVSWFLNGRHPFLHGNSYIKTKIERNVSHNNIASIIDIDFIDDIGFGNFTCVFHTFTYTGGNVYFHGRKASPVIGSHEMIIAQYNVMKYSGRESYIYATPGEVIDIRWKPMLFNDVNEDLIQFYYVNGAHYKETFGSATACSCFSYFYAVAMNWFSLPIIHESKHLLFNYSGWYETRLITCAASGVFGIHTVEYFRQIYDKKSNSFIFRQVKHPDKIYVLPNLPYFHKMDKATKDKKEEMIKFIEILSLDYFLIEKNHTLSMIAREVLVLIFDFILFILCIFSMRTWWVTHRHTILQPMRKMILDKPISKMAGQCSAVRCSTPYSCYVFCGHSDRDSVYDHLVVPMRKKNIITGFIFEECLINRSGKSIFDIHSDLLEKSEHLIFYLTSAYLEEEKFVDVQLETVLHCIKMGFISTNKVLIIIADNCELPEKLRYNLPEAAANIHDWVTIKNPDKRINLVLKWIYGLKKNPRNSDVVVSTVFLG